MMLPHPPPKVEEQEPQLVAVKSLISNLLKKFFDYTLCYAVGLALVYYF